MNAVSAHKVVVTALRATALAVFVATAPGAAVASDESVTPPETPFDATAPPGEASEPPLAVPIDADAHGADTPHVDAPDEPIEIPDHTDAPVGFGLDVAGGGLFGFTTQLRVGAGMWIDLGLHVRVALTPPDVPNHIAPALTVTWLHEMGPALVKPAYFVVLGGTPPWAYREAFIAAGPAMRVWSTRRQVSHTFAAGPGWIPLRAIPGAQPGPPLLLFFRYAMHFQRADSRIPRRR